MIKNFKKIFAIILVFILSSFYIVNLNTFADEIIFPFDMDGFDFESTEKTNFPAFTGTQTPVVLRPFNISPESCSSGESSDGDFVSSSYINPELKVQLDNVFGKLQEIHPEITVYAVNADDYKMKLALICTYMCDLLNFNNPQFNQNFSMLSYQSNSIYYDEMKSFISDAVFALFNIDLNVDLGIYGDGFDFLYSVNCMNFLEKLDPEVQEILLFYKLNKIFEPIKDSPTFSKLVFDQYGIDFNVI